MVIGDVMFHKHCFICIQKIHQYNSWLAIIFILQEVCVHNVWADVASSASCLIEVSGEVTAKFYIGFWRTASPTWWPGPLGLCDQQKSKLLVDCCVTVAEAIPNQLSKFEESSTETKFTPLPSSNCLVTAEGMH